jgi:hypothetical protein
MARSDIVDEAIELGAKGSACAAETDPTDHEAVCICDHPSLPICMRQEEDMGP